MRSLNDLRAKFLLLVVACFILAPNKTFSQANFLSIFGNSGCSTNNTLSCGTSLSTSSTSPLATISDPYTSSGIEPTLFRNSIYNRGGQLLFSVNRDGIYDATGTMQFDFSGTYIGSPTTYSIPDPNHAGLMIDFSPTYAVSEISIFPVFQECDKYYVLFWAQDNFYNQVELRLIKVSLNPTTGSMSFVDNVIYDPTQGALYQGSVSGGGLLGYRPARLLMSMVLAVDGENTSTGDRDFYTCEFNFFDYIYNHPSTGGGYSTIRKWTIRNTGVWTTASSGGVIGVNSYSYPAARAVGTGKWDCNAVCSKGKIFQIGADKYFAYIGGVTGGGFIYTWATTGYYVNLINVRTGNVLAGFVPILGTGTSAGLSTPSEAPFSISGFEYSPSLNVIFFTYTDRSASVGTGGIGYWDASGSTHFLTATPSAVDFRTSDLELNKNGDLLMVRNNSSSLYNGTTEGQLYYLPVSSSGFTLSSSISPSVVPTSCSSTPYISVLSNQLVGYSPNMAATPAPVVYHLGNQIRENLPYSGEYDLGNYTVTGSENWSPTNNPVYRGTGVSTPIIRIRGDINIPAGAELNLTGVTLEFGTGSHINVNYSPAGSLNKGGRLTLNNAKLTRHTTGCNPAITWGGVVLKGDPTQAQLTYLTSHQPAFKSYGNSEISYADVGVAATEPVLSHLFGWFFIRPRNFMGKAGGGIIMCDASTIFRNNKTGVMMMPYRNRNAFGDLPDLSYFKLTKFIWDDASITYLGTPVSGHIQLTGLYGVDVKGIPVTACTFDNQTYHIENVVGIESRDMSFVLDNYISSGVFGGSVTYPSDVTNFMIGIRHTNAANSNTPIIRNSGFHNNDIGIQANGSQFIMIAKNTFDIAFQSRRLPMELRDYSYYWSGYGFSVPSDDYAIGVLLFGSDQYTVNGNTFNGMPSGYHVGALADNTGGGQNFIKRNSYNGVRVGNLGLYKNTNSSVASPNGVEFTCNSYQNNYIDEAARGRNYLTDGICATQGSMTYGRPAKNTFSNDVSTNNSIYLPGPNHGGEVGKITYVFYSSGAANEEPGNTGVTGQVFGYEPSGSSVASDFIKTSPGTSNYACEPILDGGGSTGGGWPEGFVEFDGAHVITISKQSVTELNYRDIAANNVSYYAGDAAGIPHRDSLYYWLRQINSTGAKKMLCNLLFEDNLVTEAYALYDSITTQFEFDTLENKEYTIYGRQLLDIQNAVNHNINQTGCTQAQKQSLYNIYQHASIWAKVLAKNLINLYANEMIDSNLIATDTLLFPPHGGNKITPAQNQEPVSYSIYPNPASNTLNIEFAGLTSTDVTMEITDVYGITILNTKLKSPKAVVDISQLTPGIFLYRVSDSKGTTKCGKFIKN